MKPRFVSFIFAAALAFLAGACSRTPESSGPSAPTVAGDRIVFPAGSPQTSAIAAVAAEPRGPEVHRLAGRLVWDEDLTVRIYSPVAGRVSAVAVALGEQVEKDAVLVRIDSPDFGQVQADAHKAAADLLLAERTLARAKDLFEHGAAARKDLDAAENAQAGAESEQQRTNARRKLYGASTDDAAVNGLFTLRTPLAGILVEKNVNPGQEVRPDQQLANAPQLFAPLCVVSDPSHLRVLIDAPERELAGLRPGVPIVVRSMALADQIFTGGIDGVSDSLDPTTHMVTVRGLVDNPDRRLKAEMFVTVEFSLDGPPGVEVPAKAVFMKNERHFVYLEEQPGTYLRCEVIPGGEQEGRILVRSGLTAGQRVVTEGGLLLDEVRADAGGS
jgi:cobalt-zinc-cadmium efflux system membrane fusion protein